MPKHKVTTQRINNHKHDPVERRLWLLRKRGIPSSPFSPSATIPGDLFPGLSNIFPHGQPGQERLVREEARREDQDGDGQEDVGEDEGSEAEGSGARHRDGWCGG